MFGRVSRAVRPRLVRPVSQVLADPMAWNQAPVVVTTLSNGVKVATKETFAEACTSHGYKPTLSKTSESAQVCALLPELRRPLIGVAKGQIHCWGAQLLNACDRVLACEEATFEEGCPTAVERVPVGNLGCEMAVLARALERQSSEALASVKVDFLCSKVLHMMRPKQDDASTRSAKEELLARALQEAHGSPMRRGEVRRRSAESIKEDPEERSFGATPRAASC
eukprot:g7837.t1